MDRRPAKGTIKRMMTVVFQKMLPFSASDEKLRHVEPCAMLTWSRETSKEVETRRKGTNNDYNFTLADKR
jgi:hypothetical protein